MQLPEQIYTDLKSQLPALIDALKTGAGYGGELAHRFIVYDIVSTSMVIVFLIILLTICSVALNKLFKSYKAISGTDWRDADKRLNIGALIAGIMMIVCAASIGIIDSAFTITKDIFIPELRIIEMIQGLTSNI